ncbi:MAG: hypothetical protein JO154_02990 [Chitinophaga sp.]|uniref:hypothetical protein n=1 Tax=Chitinophaga sp. TaxID=1869181 RepID=UPI0025BFBF0E|nr:hypothetical protein [Chitinophaga sp.]MBV8251547.1 hypothetical protein [Chitinophaga sp.]
MKPDNIEIDQLVKSFFSVFTNVNGHTPDFTLIFQLCIPAAVIIKKSGLQEEIYNLQTFIAPRKQLLTDGRLTDFEEKETSGITQVLGNIAQRTSKYVKHGLLNGAEFSGRGNKLFQFIKTTTGWKIAAVVWEDE